MFGKAIANFSVALSVVDRHQPTPPFPDWSWVWKIRANPRFQLFAWLWHGRLKTKDMLHRRRICTTDSWFLSREYESLIHAYDCTFTQQMWLFIGVPPNTRPSFNQPCPHWCQINCKYKTTNQSGLAWCYILVPILRWLIWLQRNRCLFNVSQNHISQ